MRILSKYALFEFLRILLLAVAGLVLVYLVADFLEKIDNFMEAGLAWTRIVFFFLLMIPTIIFYLLPVAVLISILISVGVLARHSEIVAVKAGGVGLYRFSLPIVTAALIISVMHFMMADFIMPYTASRANEIWNIEVEQNRSADPTIRVDVWFKFGDVVYHMKQHDNVRRVIDEISVFEFDHDFVLKQRIDAASAVEIDGVWALKGGQSKTYLPDGSIEVETFDSFLYQIPELPDDVGVRKLRAAEEISSGQLSKIIARMDESGYDSLRYVVDFHMKFSFPLICLIMAFIGLPIALWKEKGGGIALGVAVGVSLSFLYLVLIGLCRALGYSGLLPPLAAAWFPNMIFLLLGAYLFTHVRQ